MKVRATKPFRSGDYGSVETGQILDVPSQRAREMVNRQIAEYAPEEAPVTPPSAPRAQVVTGKELPGFGPVTIPVAPLPQQEESTGVPAPRKSSSKR